MNSEISISDSLARLLRTQKGSRVMYPNYGVDWNRYTDANRDIAWSIDLISEISDALDTYEPRIFVKKIIVEGQEKLKVNIITETEKHSIDV